MIKLKNILSEIGEGNAQPFKWKADTNFNSWLKQTIAKGDLIAGSMDRIIRVPDFNYSFTSDITNTVYEVNINASVGNRPNKIVKAKETLPKVKLFIECSVSFGVSSSNQEEDTNLNEQYRIMATVTQCIFDFVKRLEETGQVNLTEMYIMPKSDKDNQSNIDSKRGRLYMAYIDKMISKIPSPRKFRIGLLGSGEGYVLFADE